MSKNLFTRLYYTQCMNHTEEATSKIIDKIVSKAFDTLIAKEIQQQQIDMLHEESMNKQTFTVEQAFTRNPFRTVLTQDKSVFSYVKESARPLSAKINTLKKIVNKPRNTRRSICRYSRASIIKSSKSIPSNIGYNLKKSRLERENSQRFVLLPDESQSENFEEKQYIATLREKKIKEQAYQRQKQRFFKTMAENQEKTDKINKKFLQQMGHKNFYYTKNGELMQTSNHHISSKILKKTITSKTQNSKRQNNGDNTKTETIVIEYKQKENPIKKVNQTIFIQTGKKNLFYKSENCKYKLLA